MLEQTCFSSLFVMMFLAQVNVEWGALNWMCGSANKNVYRLWFYCFTKFLVNIRSKILTESRACSPLSVIFYAYLGVSLPLFEKSQIYPPNMRSSLPLYRAASDQYPLTVIDFVLNDLRCPASEGFDSSLHLRGLILNLDCFIPPARARTAEEG